MENVEKQKGTEKSAPNLEKSSMTISCATRTKVAGKYAKQNSYDCVCNKNDIWALTPYTHISPIRN